MENLLLCKTPQLSNVEWEANLKLQELPHIAS